MELATKAKLFKLKPIEITCQFPVLNVLKEDNNRRLEDANLTIACISMRLASDHACSSQFLASPS